MAVARIFVRSVFIARAHIAPKSFMVSFYFIPFFPIIASLLCAYCWIHTAVRARVWHFVVFSHDTNNIISFYWWKLSCSICTHFAWVFQWLLLLYLHFSCAAIGCKLQSVSNTHNAQRFHWTTKKGWKWKTTTNDAQKSEPFYVSSIIVLLWPLRHRTPMHEQRALFPIYCVHHARRARPSRYGDAHFSLCIKLNIII